MTAEALLRCWADIVRSALCVTVGWLLIDGRAPAAYSLTLIALTAIASRRARASAVAEAAFVSLLATDAWMTCTGVMARIDEQDRAGHFLLTIAVTPILAAAIEHTPCPPRSNPPVAVLAGLAAAALVVGWEVAEWLSDSLLLTNMSLDATDTTHDLISGLAGATAGAAITAYALARRAVNVSSVSTKHKHPSTKQKQP